MVPPAQRLRALASSVGRRYYDQPDPGTTQELGLRWLAGLVLVASAETEALDTSAGSLGYEVDASVLRPVVEARGNLSILDARTGRTLVTRRFDDVRGSDSSSPERAGRQALHRLADEMRRFVVERLTTYVEELGFPLRVVIRGSAAKDGGAKVRDLLEATRWVERVELAKEDGQRTHLEVTCRENPFYVVEELRGGGSVEVLRFDRARGEVEVR